MQDSEKPTQNLAELDTRNSELSVEFAANFSLMPGYFLLYKRYQSSLEAIISAGLI